MWRTNLAVGLTVLGTLAAYTAVANLIPQLESDVPSELVLSANASTQELVAAGENVYLGAGGCTACHGLGTRAPDLLEVAGSVCRERRPALKCKEYLYESLTDPAAYVVEGFQAIMPDLRRTLSEEQVWATVAFLQSQGGAVTVTSADFAASEPEDQDMAASDASVAGTGEAGDTTNPRGILETAGCLACHALEGEGGLVGPPFDGMGGGLDADYIRRSILFPQADTARGYEAFAGTMPATFADQLTAGQLESIVRFLSESQ
jgi:mono/diheme cytochrome c family protein